MKAISKLLIIIISIFIIMLGYNHVRQELDLGGYTTEIAYYSSVSNSLIGNAFLIREEFPMEYSGNKIINYMVKDGEKLGLNTPIAKLFDSQAGIQLINDLEGIEKDIELLTEISLLKGSKHLISDKLYQQISDDVGELISIINGKVLNEMEHIEHNLFINLIKENLGYGRIRGLDKKIQELAKKKDEYESKLSNVSIVYSPIPGYFSRYVDGYENLYIPDDLKSCSYDDYLNIFNSKANKVDSKKYLGKIVTNYEWSIIFKTEKNKLTLINNGSNVEVNIKSLGLDKIPATIVDIKEDEDNVILILKCTYISKNILMLRRANTKIFSNTFYGISVNPNSVRFLDGKKGVFIIKGKEIKFKQIDPLIELDDEIISQVHQLEENYLNTFDEVIIDGQNLYDGKILK